MLATDFLKEGARLRLRKLRVARLDDDEEAVIRVMGDRMRERGIIDDEYLDGVLERERISSTAFTRGAPWRTYQRSMPKMASAPTTRATASVTG